jgi:hypothetical protein
MKACRPAVVALLLTLASAGCAVGHPQARDSRPSSSPTSLTSLAGKEFGGRLKIAVEDPGGRWRSYLLTCDPDGGTHPLPQVACRSLESADEPFVTPTSRPAGRRCYPLASTVHAVVTGTWHGRPVAVTFDRSNTCTASRWAELAFLFIPLNGAAIGDRFTQ